MILHSKLVPQPEIFMYRWFSMRIGYIGIIKPLNPFELLDGQIDIHTDRKYFDIPMLHIKINNNKESDINLNWSKVLEILKNKL